MFLVTSRTEIPDAPQRLPPGPGSHRPRVLLSERCCPAATTCSEPTAPVHRCELQPDDHFLSALLEQQVEQRPSSSFPLNNNHQPVHAPLHPLSCAARACGKSAETPRPPLPSRSKAPTDSSRARERRGAHMPDDHHLSWARTRTAQRGPTHRGKDEERKREKKRESPLTH